MKELKYFNEAELVRQLELLPHQNRVAFAAACAERLSPFYEQYSSKTGRGDPAMLRALLAQIWLDLENSTGTVAELDERISKCMSLIPDECDEKWVPEQSSAEDASAAVAYALECQKSGASIEAAWAARRAYEAVSSRINETESNPM